METRSLVQHVADNLKARIRPWAKRAEKLARPVVQRAEPLLGRFPLVQAFLKRVWVLTVEPSHGQAGSAEALPAAGGNGVVLNEKERRVLQALASGPRAMTLGEITGACFVSEGDRERANSWVRNSLRRLMRENWVERVDRGAYRATAAGLARLGS